MARGGSKPGERRGGRAKGTPNKVNQDVVSQLEALGFNPLAELVQIALDVDKEIKQRKQEKRHVSIGLMMLKKEAIADVMQYAYPKRKAIDHTTGGKQINSMAAFVASLDEEDEPGNQT